MPLPSTLRAAAAVLALSLIGTISPLSVRPSAAESRPAAAQAADLVEVTFWNTVKDSFDPRDLRDYLKNYPKGHFVTLAKRRVDRLEGRPAVPDTPSEAAGIPEPPSAAPSATFNRLVRHYVQGEGYDTTDNSSYERCSRRCLDDDRCQMLEFYKPKRKCNLFDHRRTLKTTDSDAEVALRASTNGGD